MKFNTNDRVWITPDDTDMFQFVGRIKTYDQQSKLYAVIDMENNLFNFYEHEMELENNI